MNSLMTALLIQIVLCVLLFAVLFYLMVKNAELKEQIRVKLDNTGSKTSED